MFVGTVLDRTKVRMALEDYADLARRGIRYHVLEFEHTNRMTGKREAQKLYLLHDDFVLDDQTMFTHDEAMIIEDIAKELGMRLPKAREWGGIAFFISHDDLAHFDLSRFNLAQDGYLWDNTPFKQEEGKSTYYWSGSGGRGKEYARAIHIVPGKFDILSRPVSQGMNLKFLITTN